MNKKNNLLLIFILVLCFSISPFFAHAEEKDEIENNTQVEEKNEEKLETSEKHMITYVLNGGTCKENECINGEVDDGTVLTKPEDPKLDNHNFVKWCTDENCENEFDFSTEIKDDYTLYAIFEEIKNISLWTDTTSFDYGTASVGFKDNIVKKITIKNTGSKSLTLSISNPTSDGPFASLDFENGKVLAPNEEYEVTLIANPNGNKADTPGEYTGTYVIKGTSEDSEETSVSITAGITIKGPDIKVSYSTHVQNIGWQDYVSNGAQAGTDHKSLRMEAMKIKLENNPYEGNIEYKTHIQDIGWETGFKKNDEMTGTAHRSLRLEAIEVKLTGEVATKYDVYYRVHAQNFGWLGWARNGEQSGTAGYSYRLEAIEIVLVEKDKTFSEYGKTATFYNKKTNTSYTPGKSSSLVSYSTHIQNIGWQHYVSDGATSGTSHQSLRLEGIKIKLVNTPYSGDIEYKTHVQSIGWESKFTKNDQMSGTSRRSLRLEAIMIRLTGTMSELYDVYYRVHVQNLGWLGWARNGEKAGTEGYSFRLEAIEIKVVSKNTTFSEYGQKATYYNGKSGSSYTPNNGDASQGEWKVVNGKTYYIYKDGTKAKYLTKIGGIRYEFSKDGELQHSNVKVVADLSAHNAEHGPINWDLLWSSGEIDELIFRISYSIGMDRQFKNFLAEARRLNIPYSVYIFSTAENESEASTEGKQIVSWYKDLNLNTSMGVFYDLESWYHVSTGHSSNGISVSMYDKIIETFKSELDKAGIKMSVYASKNYAETRFGNYGRSQVGWIAQYASVCQYKGTYRGWQYTSTGSLPGITGNVDLSVFYY